MSFLGGDKPKTNDSKGTKMSTQKAQNELSNKPLLSTPGCVKVAAPVAAVGTLLIVSGNTTWAAIAASAAVLAAFAAGGIKLVVAARK